MSQFNKIIDLKFKTDTEEFEIKTPRHGVKPQIKVSGNITAGGFCSNFEVEVTNLYTNDIKNISEITVQAGYEDELSAGITGKVQFVYTASPGPDMVTVICCTSANYDSWINATINMKLKAGFSLTEAITQISNALNFEPAFIVPSIANKVCAAPLEVNGKCSEAIKQLKNASPDVSIFPNGNKLVVFPTRENYETIMEYELPLLTQAPQFSGGIASIVAPWNPMIKPGDIVKFPTQFYSRENGAMLGSSMTVTSVQFSFATNTDENDMTLTGTLSVQGA